MGREIRWTNQKSARSTTPLSRWRKLGANRPNAHRSNAALLEFLPTAAGTRIVSPNAFDWLLKGLAAGTFSFLPSPPTLLIVPVLLGETVPPG